MLSKYSSARNITIALVTSARGNVTLAISLSTALRSGRNVYLRRSSSVDLFDERVVDSVRTRSVQNPAISTPRTGLVSRCVSADDDRKAAGILHRALSRNPTRYISGEGGIRRRRGLHGPGRSPLSSGLIVPFTPRSYIRSRAIPTRYTLAVHMPFSL